MSDGVSLNATAHPRKPWGWLRFWLWDRWRSPRMSPESLEPMEITIHPETNAVNKIRLRRR